jgi:DNA polymerase elongation subunit (family B)
MEQKWAQIDLQTCTKEELKAEIERLKSLRDLYMNAEQAIKIFINSVYGACGSPWFAFFNTDVAEAVTLQGQDLIKYSEKVLNRYFLEFWHKDVKIHQKMGLTRVDRLERPVVIYCDTDSNFVSFKEVLDKCDWQGTSYAVKNHKTGEDDTVVRDSSAKHFILALYDLFLEDYLNKCYDIYAKNCGTKNFQSFELEKISDAGVWLAKKKYVYNTIWKDPGIDVEPLTDITAKGVEIVQSSSSKFVRDTLKNLLKYIFTKKKDFNVVEFAGILKKYKDEYRLKNLEDIAASSAIGDYEKHVLMDRDRLVLEKACPIHVRAAAIYNHKLHNSKYKKKYQPIRSGEKVKYYHVKTNNPEENVFAFISGSFPVEFAPPLDYDVQFAKNIVQPINRFVEAMGYSPISSQLVVSTQLF